MSQLYPSIETQFPATWKEIRVAVFLKGESFPRVEYAFNKIEEAQKFSKSVKESHPDVTLIILGPL